MALATVSLDAAALEGCLGATGKGTLLRVLDLLRNAAVERHWPLSHISVQPVQDAEVAGWNYTLVLLRFSSSFTEADNYLHEFYTLLDNYLPQLSSTDQDLIRKKIFFDLESPAAVLA